MSVERLALPREGALFDVEDAFLRALDPVLRTTEVSLAARNFLESINVPDQYSWIGLYGYTDDVGHDRLAFYVLETEAYVRGDINPCDQADIVPPLTELFATLVPSVYVDLQPLKPGISTAPNERAQAHLLESLSSQRGRPELLVERELETRY